MTRRFLPLILALFAVLLMAADLGRAPSGSVDPAERARILASFDHTLHTSALRKESLGCPACHSVGGSAAAGTSAEVLHQAFLAPPPAACHYCHNPPEAQKARGPRTCALCHEAEMRPSTHGADWTHEHGDESRMAGRTCYDCHRRSMCVDCHQRKDTTTWRVHDPTWIMVHGIAVASHPSECSTCHLQADCLACHANPDGRPQ